MKSNYTIKEWIEAVRRGFTPDGRQLAEVEYNTKSGTLLQGQIETFAGDSPIPIGKDKNKWKFKGRSVVLTSDNIADGTRFLTAWLSISS